MPETTLGGKLLQLKDVKQGLKQVLLDQGIDLNEVQFTEYPEKFVTALESAQEILSTLVTLTATSQIPETGGTITYTATLGRPAITDVTVNLSNGQTITIPGGNLSGTEGYILVGEESVHLDSTTVDVTITSCTGGGFDEIEINPVPASTVVNDVIDITYLQFDDIEANQGSFANIVFRLTEAPAVGHPLTITLSTGDEVVLDSTYVPNENVIVPDYQVGDVNTTITVTSIVGGNFEQLDTSDICNVEPIVSGVLAKYIISGQTRRDADGKRYLINQGSGDDILMKTGGRFNGTIDTYIGGPLREGDSTRVFKRAIEVDTPTDKTRFHGNLYGPLCEWRQGVTTNDEWYFVAGHMDSMFTVPRNGKKYGELITMWDSPTRTYRYYVDGVLVHTGTLDESIELLTSGSNSPIYGAGKGVTHRPDSSLGGKMSLHWHIATGLDLSDPAVCDAIAADDYANPEKTFYLVDDLGRILGSDIFDISQYNESTGQWEATHDINRRYKTYAGFFVAFTDFDIDDMRKISNNFGQEGSNTKWTVGGTGGELLSVGSEYGYQSLLVGQSKVGYPNSKQGFPIDFEATSDSELLTNTVFNTIIYRFGDDGNPFIAPDYTTIPAEVNPTLNQEIFYIDAVNGDDTVGDGTIGNPFKTQDVLTIYHNEIYGSNAPLDGEGNPTTPKIYLAEGTYERHNFIAVRDYKGLTIMPNPDNVGKVISYGYFAYGCSNLTIDGISPDKFKVERKSLNDNYTMVEFKNHPSHTEHENSGVRNCEITSLIAGEDPTTWTETHQIMYGLGGNGVRVGKSGFCSGNYIHHINQGIGMDGNDILVEDNIVAYVRGDHVYHYHCENSIIRGNYIHSSYHVDEKHKDFIQGAWNKNLRIYNNILFMYEDNTIPFLQSELQGGYIASYWHERSVHDQPKPEHNGVDENGYLTMDGEKIQFRGGAAQGLCNFDGQNSQIYIFNNVINMIGAHHHLSIHDIEHSIIAFNTVYGSISQHGTKDSETTDNYNVQVNNICTATGYNGEFGPTYPPETQFVSNNVVTNEIDGLDFVDLFVDVSAPALGDRNYKLKSEDVITYPEMAYVVDAGLGFDEEFPITLLDVDGNPITKLSDIIPLEDIDGNPRSSTTPDLGAYEFAELSGGGAI